MRSEVCSQRNIAVVPTLQLRRTRVFRRVVQLVGSAGIIALLEEVRRGFQDGHILRAGLRADREAVRQSGIAV